MQSKELPQVSVIIPCYNALGKIQRCLLSLERITLEPEKYEVLFVDDGSTDGTDEILSQAARAHPHWKVIRLEQNSGSPSRPRNRGCEEAAGAYVFFLDADDEVLPDTLAVHVAHAEATKADVVRGYLLADDGRQRKAENRLAEWRPDVGLAEKISMIIRRQSTTTPTLIRTGLLRQHHIRWPEDLRMGEDTCFLVDVLAAATVVEYVDHPTFVYHKSASWTPSSTQEYGDKELRDHLVVWQDAERKLAAKQISYTELRLQVGLQTALRSMVWRSRGDTTDETLRALSEYVRARWSVIEGFTLSERYREIVAVIRQGDTDAIRSILRPRLVISGYDLKFILSLIPLLERRFEIQVDEWTGHATHDERQSEALLEWGEVIWCEWLLENAVWWSHRKRRGQVLFVRMHRFELSRDFGHRVNADAVDCFFCVSVLWFEWLIETFGYDRRRVRLLPNVVDTEHFDAEYADARLKNLALVGFVPERKGLRRALELLALLREVDPGYRLHLFGKRPEEVDWIASQPSEMSYFAECQAFVREHGLAEAVIEHGHVDLSTALASHQIGFVLSVSESESFHFGPAEGFAGGGQGVFLRWEGAEFIYPERFVFSSLTELRDYILSQSTPEAFQEGVHLGRSFVSERYAADRFLRLVNGCVAELAP